MYFRVLSLLTLGVCSYTDIKCRRIYKKILILYGLLILDGKIYEIFAQLLTDNHDEVLLKLFGGIVLGMLPGLACLFLSRISGEALGYGDSLLILICGSALGLAECIYVLSAAFFLSGIAALLLFFFKRKSRKYEIPFVPFLFLGVLLLTAAG